MKDVKNIVGILLGNTIYALGVVMFILPNNLITGGTTGMALLINATTGFSITIFVYLFKSSFAYLDQTGYNQITTCSSHA